MIQKEAWCWTLVLMVVSTAAVLSSPKEKSKSALADPQNRTWLRIQSA